MMMVKRCVASLRMVFVLAMLVVILQAAGVAEEAAGQVQQTTVLRSVGSPTGYYVTFCYEAPEAARVRIRGEWSFSGARGSSPYTSENVLPEDYEEGMFPLQADQDRWPISDMTLDTETGIWRYTIALPSGVWSYRFIVGGGQSAAVDDLTGTWETTDPNNPPLERSPGQQTNSQVYVPFDPERQEKDFSLQMPRTDEKRGTLELCYYDASGLQYELLDEPVVAVYLPYGYDPNREEPYNVLYALHGSGVESETSWWNKGAIGNLTDNLIADCGVEPFVIVMPNSYADSFDYENILENILPAVEAQYNICDTAEGRAICGISLGALCAKNILINAPEAFSRYGLFSGPYFSDSSEQFEGAALRVATSIWRQGNGRPASWRSAAWLKNCNRQAKRISPSIPSWGDTIGIPGGRSMWICPPRVMGTIARPLDMAWRHLQPARHFDGQVHREKRLFGRKRM